MGVNKVGLSTGETLIDISNDTVTPDTLAEGATAHNAQGEPITGTMKASVSVQADYEQYDETQPDYIKNKPFYEKGQKSYYSSRENPNPVSFISAATNHIFYKISDIVVEKRQIFNGEIRVMAGSTHSGLLEDVTPKESEILIDTNDFVLTLATYGFMFAYRAGKANFVYSGYSLSLDIPEAGIYCVFNGTETAMPTDRIYEITLVEETKQIDPKFIAVDETLKINEAGAIGVNVATEITENNTQPVTSAAVAAVIGNISAILDAL